MTITEDIRAIVERVKNLGPEWRHPADLLTDAMGAAEHAQNAHLRYLTTCIDEANGRLAYHKQEIRTLPEQIAKWEAERAHLESQTGADIVREAVGAEKPREPSPNRFDCEECGTGVSADEDGCCATCGKTCWQWVDGECVLAGGTEPEEMPVEVEAMADAREKQEAEKPEPPALLDLRTLKVGDEVQLMEACHTLGGYRLVVGQKVRIAGVSIAEKDGSTWTVTPCVPARVVEVPR